MKQAARCKASDLPPDLESANGEARHIANDKNCNNSAANFCKGEVSCSPGVETAFSSSSSFYQNAKPSPRRRPWPGNSGDPGENTQVEDDEGADRQQDCAHQRVHHLEKMLTDRHTDGQTDRQQDCAHQRVHHLQKC